MAETETQEIGTIIGNGLPGGPLVTARQVEEMLGCHPNTLYNWRKSGRPHLPYQKLGGRIYYEWAGLKDFLVNNRR